MSTATSAAASGHPGRSIQVMRRTAGLTLEELATRSGSDKGYISRVERGERTPSAYWLQHLSRVLADAVAERAAS